MASIWSIQSPKLTSWLYLNGTSNRRYTGVADGTPWTVLATTPFSIAMNDTTGPQWTVQNPVPTLIMGDSSGTALGSHLLERIYAPKEEVIPIQAYATSSANLVILKRLLENAIVNGATLYVQPEGMTGAYYAILTGRVQELPSTINTEARQNVLRALLILTVQPLGFGQALTTRASGSATNNGTAITLTDIGGDEAVRPYLDLELYGGALATTGMKVVHVASGVTAAVNNDTPVVSTTSTSGVTISTNSATLAINSGTTPYNRTIRATCRLTSPTANLEVRLLVRLGSTTGMVVYTSPWVAPGAVATAYVDCGAFRLTEDIYRAARRIGTQLYIERQARSTDGGSATATWAQVAAIAHQTWARLTTLQSLGTNQRVRIIAYGDMLLGQGQQPLLFPEAFITDSSGSILQRLDVRGVLPRAYDNLYAIWTASGVYTSADTATLVATAQPLFTTFGGI